MINYTYRLWCILIFSISLFVFFASFYFQYVLDLQPCPLCLMQRFCVLLVLILSLLGLFLSEKCSKGLIIAHLIVALAGVYFASRQIWLQSLPVDKMPACLPGLDVMLQYFPWRDILHALIWGAADCGEVTWQWLGLSMAAWSLFYFLGLLLSAVFAAFSLWYFGVKYAKQ